MVASFAITKVIRHTSTTVLTISKSSRISRFENTETVANTTRYIYALSFVVTVVLTCHTLVYVFTQSIISLISLYTFAFIASMWIFALFNIFFWAEEINFQPKTIFAVSWTWWLLTTLVNIFTFKISFVPSWSRLSRSQKNSSLFLDNLPEARLAVTLKWSRSIPTGSVTSPTIVRVF